MIDKKAMKQPDDKRPAMPHKELQRLITAGIESGTSDETIDDIWQRVKKKPENGYATTLMVSLSKPNEVTA